jgi:hypothetical protein
VASSIAYVPPGSTAIGAAKSKWISTPAFTSASDFGKGAVAVPLISPVGPPARRLTTRQQSSITVASDVFLMRSSTAAKGDAWGLNVWRSSPLAVTWRNVAGSFIWSTVP